MNWIQWICKTFVQMFQGKHFTSWRSNIYNMYIWEQIFGKTMATDIIMLSHASQPWEAFWSAFHSILLVFTVLLHTEKFSGEKKPSKDLIVFTCLCNHRKLLLAGQQLGMHSGSQLCQRMYKNWSGSVNKVLTLWETKHICFTCWGQAVKYVVFVMHLKLEQKYISLLISKPGGSFDKLLIWTQNK